MGEQAIGCFDCCPLCSGSYRCLCEKLTYVLHEGGHAVGGILPNRISSYQRTLDIKTVTDKTAAEAITGFGLERKLQQWEKPKPLFKKLRQLTREQRSIDRDPDPDQKSIACGAGSGETEQRKCKTLKTADSTIGQAGKGESRTRKFYLCWKLTNPLKSPLKTALCSLPGVGILTAVIVLAETNGFELIRNKRQLRQLYAGFDVKEKQSGTSVKGKPRMLQKRKPASTQSDALPRAGGHPTGR